MINKKEFAKEMSLEKEIYGEMISQIDIPNFTKCLAQYSGMHIKDLDQSAIKKILRLWCENKEKYFIMFGNKTMKDFNISYNVSHSEIENSYSELIKEYPEYYHWFKDFMICDKNKIDQSVRFGYSFTEVIERLFPQYTLQGTTVIQFFKKCLNAPDNLITRLGRVYENTVVEGTYTISIDPTDMMTASENPYNWRSCYKLATESDSHADGCVAAIIDTSSIIGYVWSKEGDLNLYGEYQLKNIKYKKMRQWISLSPDLDALHFNALYPGKDRDEEINKIIREIVEEFVCGYTKAENYWGKATNRAYCERLYGYGYSEFNNSYIYMLTAKREDLQVNDKYISWKAYDHQIPCLCGCGGVLPAQDDYDEDCMEYNGEGFTCNNFYESEESYYCEDAGDYCENGQCCNGCYYRIVNEEYEELAIPETDFELRINYAIRRDDIRISASMFKFVRNDDGEIINSNIVAREVEFYNYEGLSEEDSENISLIDRARAYIIKEAKDYRNWRVREEALENAWSIAFEEYAKSVIHLEAVEAGIVSHTDDMAVNPSDASQNEIHTITIDRGAGLTFDTSGIDMMAAADSVVANWTAYCTGNFEQISIEREN